MSSCDFVVWLTSWEWECCGDRFALGDDVEWQLLPIQEATRSWLSALFGPVVAGQVTHEETHHDVEERRIAVPMRGRVLEIMSAFSRRAAADDDPVTLYPTPGSGRLASREAVNGFDPTAWSLKGDPVESHEGYLVKLGASSSPREPSG
jgi:hypothetical protein